MNESDARGTASAAPAEPPAVARWIAIDLVSRYGLRVADQRDSRLGRLAGKYDLALAAWTGTRGLLVALYRPPADPIEAAADLEARCRDAFAWGVERLDIQRADTCDVLLVAVGKVARSGLSQPQKGRVTVGVVAVDPDSGGAESLLASPSGLPSAPDIRRRVRAFRSGGEAPTLAAIDLAARDIVETGRTPSAARPLAKTPVVTYALICVFVAVWVLEKVLITQSSGVGLVDLGALVNAAGAGLLGHYDLSAGAWWRYVSSAFLHDDQSIVHVAVNAFAMWNIGRFVEIWYGRLVLLGTFVLAAVAGGVAWVVLTSGDTAVGMSVGASGGICGLMGLLILVGRVQGKQFPRETASRVRRWIGVNAALVLFTGISALGGVVNNYAHAGGFVAGLGLALVLPPRTAIGGRELRKVETGALALVVGAALVALGFAGVHVASAVGPAQKAVSVDGTYSPTVTVGEQTHFDFTVDNVGPSRITNVTILFDDGDHFLDHYTVLSSGPCTVEHSLPGLACGPLAPGAEMTFTLTAKPRDSGSFTFKFHVGDGLLYLAQRDGSVYTYGWPQTITA